jgi:hypothetical protein
VRGLKGRNSFTQRAVQQAPNVWLHLGLLHYNSDASKKDVTEYAGYELG